MIELETTQWLEYMKSQAQLLGISVEELIAEAHEDAANIICNTEKFKKWEEINFPNKKDEENK